MNEVDATKFQPVLTFKDRYVETVKMMFEFYLPANIILHIFNHMNQRTWGNPITDLKQN